MISFTVSLFSNAQSVCTTPSFTPVATYASGGNFLIATTAADFNKDGVPDLAVANNFSPTLGVLLGKGDGSFKPVVTYATGSNESCLWITSGDFNKDGKMDIVVAIGGSKGIGILLGKGDGSFEPIKTYPTNNVLLAIATGDFNKDGNLDLAGAGGPVDVLLGKGDGTFKEAISYIGGAYANFVVFGDFNNDKTDDLAVTSSIGQEVSVLMGKGDGTFEDATTYSSNGDNPSSVAVGDFNKDGKPDLAVANSGGGTIGVLLGKGDGSFASVVTYSGGSIVPFSVVVGDFNGDGKDDLAASSYSGEGSGLIGVLLGKGDGSFSAVTTFPSGGNAPYSLTVGDFNRDGKLDLVASNSNNGNAGTAGVLLNNCGNSNLKTFYRDKDADGFGNPNVSVQAVSRPAGYVANKLDCDDAKITYKDNDGDGYGSEVKVPCNGVPNNYDSNDGDGKPRIYVCHKGATIVVNAHAAKGHLKHGDYLGRCSAASVTQRSVRETEEATGAQQLSFAAAPNPFTYVTRFQYSLAEDARIKIEVYNAAGRTVQTLFEGQQRAGTYTHEFNASKLAAGVYYCRLLATANGKETVQTLKLVKTE